jgi:hypothetical protein
MNVRRKRIVLYAILCLRCERRWGATPAALKRPCPFCGSARTRLVR